MYSSHEQLKTPKSRKSAWFDKLEFDEAASLSPQLDESLIMTQSE